VAVLSPGANWYRRWSGQRPAYYNNHPVASILPLNGPFGQTDRDAHLAKDVALAQWFRPLIAADHKGPYLPCKPDVAAIAVELAFAVLKYGYAREGTISNTVCDEATGRRRRLSVRMSVALPHRIITLWTFQISSVSRSIWFGGILRRWG
jgi:hypothetical protein